MNRITVDGLLKVQLGGLDAPVELVDEAGHRLGHFVPAVLPSADDCPYSANELGCMRGEPGGRPLSEIWKSLSLK